MPEFIIESSEYGWNHGGRFRFANDERHVRNILKGLLGWYPDAEVRVYAIKGLDDVTGRFLLGAGE